MTVRIPLHAWLSSFVLAIALFASAVPGSAAETAPAPACSFDAATASFVRSARGELPQGWRDDSAWSQAQCTYAHREEEGQSFWNIAITAAGPGKEAQWCTALPTLAAGRYRLRLRVRALGGEQIGFGIRLAGAPYRYLWEHKQTFAYRWEEYTWSFTLAAPGQPVGLWFLAGTPAQVDISRLSLERVQVVAGDLGTIFTGGLLRDDRLPLGLPAGWNLSHQVSVGPDADEVVVDQERGDDGAPALRLSARVPVGLYMEPFAIPDPERRWEATLVLRGVGKTRLAVRAGSRELYGREVQLSDTWTRITMPVPVDPGAICQRLFLSLTAGNSVALDHLRVALAPPGEQTPLAEQAPQTPMVALTAAAGDAALADIHFADEPAGLRWAVLRAPAGSRLALRVETADGAQRDLPLQALAGTPSEEGTTAYAGSSPLYGPHRIEARVLDAAGNAISPVAERVLYRLPRPRAWGRDAVDSPFGVHVDPSRQLLTMAKAVGINWARLHDTGHDLTGWYFLEPRPGEWQFKDEAVARYRAAKLALLAPLGTAPQWASVCPAAGFTDNAYSAKFSLPRDDGAFTAYVRTVITRYRGQVAAWGVWNEPWMDCYLAAGYRADQAAGGKTAFIRAADAPAAYTGLTRTVRQAVDDLDPGRPVVAAESTSGSSGPGMFDGEDWSRRLVAAGQLDTATVASFHTYLSGPLGAADDRVAQALHHAMGPILAAKPGIPVWMTEGTSTINLIGSGSYRIAVPRDEEDIWLTSDRTCRFVVRLLANGVAKTFLFSMHCWNDIPGTRVFRSIVGIDGRLHPSGAAHAIMAWQLEGRPHAGAATLAGGVHGELFGDGKTAVLVAMPGDDGAPWFPRELPSGVSAADVFGNPVTAATYRPGTLVWFSAEVGAQALAAALGGSGTAGGK